jgi:hypothetical protein
VEKEARTWIREHGVSAEYVAGIVRIVQTGVNKTAPSGSEAESALYELAQVAQKAHDQIDEVRNNFATTETNGAVGKAAVEVFTAANELKNAMGAIVAYTGNPNPATLAHFTSQYTPAREEWNEGVKAIWSLAHKSKPPTI